MSEEQKERARELTRERMRKMRQRKKEGAGLVQPAQKSTRSATTKAKERRQYKTEKQQRYRAKMSASKKRAVRRKDADYRTRKRAELKEETVKKASKPKPDAATHVHTLIEAATPRTSKKLQQSHIYKISTRKSIVEAFRSVTSSHKKVVVDCLRKTPPKNKSGLAAAIGIRRGTLSYRPKGRKNVNRKLWGEGKRMVEEFYKSSEISILMPNKRKVAVATPFYVMQCSLLSAFKSFRIKHPDLKIGLFTFQRTRPQCVQLLKKMKWLQCVCDICANIKYIFSAIRGSMLRHNFEVPGWIQELPIESGLESICCGETRFSSSCIERLCKDCGPQLLLRDLDSWASDNVHESIKWKEWRKGQQTINKKVVSRMRLEINNGTRSEILQLLQKKLEGFGKHAFFARWQQLQYSKCVETIEKDVVVTVVDFSENFSIVQQAEAQSAYYSHNQVTIHPCVCNYLVNGKLIRDSVVFVSDDLRHDAAAVGTFIAQLIEHLKMQLPSIQRLIVWSDGCSAQYKSKQPFTNLASKFGNPDIDFEWHFFGSRHGKNASDGETGVVKSKMSRLMIGEQVFIDSAEDFAKAAAKHLTNLDGDSLRHIYFVPTHLIELTRSKQLPPKAIRGSRDIHAIHVTQTGVLATNTASCFCNYCRGGKSCLSGVGSSVLVTVLRGLSC